MKSLLLTTILFLSSFSFSQIDENDFSLASVGDQIYGVYVFVNAKPAHAYDYIATVKVKVTWTGNPRESFEKAIKKAKKKYSNFNGMIFHSDDLSKVDLINFKKLDVVRGGVAVGDYASFVNGNSQYFGEVVELESGKGKAGVKYLNEYGETVIDKVKYGDIVKMDPEDYNQKLAQFKEDIKKYEFEIGEKVNILVIEMAKKVQYEAEVIQIDGHKLTVKYTNSVGEEQIIKEDRLDVVKIKD